MKRFGCFHPVDGTPPFATDVDGLFSSDREPEARTALLASVVRTIWEPCHAAAAIASVHTGKARRDRESQSTIDRGTAANAPSATGVNPCVNTQHP